MSTDDGWPTYKVTLKHDKGFAIITTRAPNLASLVSTIMNSEGCPERAIKKIERVDREAAIKKFIEGGKNTRIQKDRI